MPSAQDAVLQYESGQTPFAMSALTDSGDHKTFTSNAALFSGVAGSAPVVRPNGLITGGAVGPAGSATNDAVDTEAMTCYLAGVKTTVNASTDKALTRGSTGSACIVNSITVNSSGAIAVVAGTAGAAIVETRGATGGPPLIPVTSIEIAQVRLTSLNAAVVTADEILSVPGVHLERYDYPVFEEHNETGSVVFNAALPLIHTGALPKKVYASYAEPVFADLPNVSDWVPPEITYSSTSVQIYGGTVGSSSKSLGAGGFTAYLKNGVTDAILASRGKMLWFKFYPDKYAPEYQLCQGILGGTTAFPAAGNITAKCTIAPFKPALNKDA